MSELSEVEQFLLAAQAEAITARGHTLRCLSHIERSQVSGLRNQTRQLHEIADKLRAAEKTLGGLWEEERSRRKR